MELRERLNPEGNFSSCEEKAEKWKGRRDGRDRLEAVNTERTAKKDFVSGGHRWCVCMCFTLSDYDAYRIEPLTYQCAETYYRVSM